MVAEKNEVVFTSHQFEKIVGLLRNWNRFDMHAYKEQTVMRRLSRRIHMVGCSSADEYFAYLEKCPTEIESLFNDLLIEVTSFFRDPEAFASLRAKVIKDLPAKDVSELRIWVPACASGQEAYSVAILIAEAIKESGIDISYRIFATDISDEAIQFSSAGVYSSEMLEGLSDELRHNYFYAIDENRFRVHPRLRSRISFFKHNILSDPPFPYIDLICCRNLLIYFKPEFQQQVICTFHFSLRQNGSLFLGSSESLGSMNHGFLPVDSRWRIYQKNSEVRLPFEAHRLKPEPVQINHFDSGIKGNRLNPHARLIDIYDNLMSLQSRPGIILDSRYEIIHINGDVMKFFPTVKGRLTSQLLEWAEGELRISLSTALARANTSEKAVSIDGVTLQFNDRNVLGEIIVSPFFSMNEKYYFVEVCEAETKDRPLAEKFTFNLDKEAQHRIENLEVEVKELQNSLYCALEEKKSSQEELQASNEELRASNEELQSSNEELQAISSEHEEKIRELISVNNDFKNLLISTDIALVFLDQNLRIRRFTPVAEKLLKLSSKDIDRNYSSIRSDLIDSEALKNDARQTLELGYPVESEIKLLDGRTFFYRMLPYRNEASEIQGVVLTYTDTTNLRAAESAFLDSEIRFQAAMDAVNDAIWSYDVKSEVFDFSDRWMKITERDCRCKNLTFEQFLDFIYLDDRDLFKQQFKQLFDGNSLFEHDFRISSASGKDWKWVFSRGRAIEFDDSGRPLRVLGTLSDISFRKQLEIEQQQKQSMLSLLCDGIGLGFWRYVPTLDMVEIDSIIRSMVGLDAYEFSVESLLKLCYPGDKKNVLITIGRVVKGISSSAIIEFRVSHSSHLLWLRLSAIASEHNADGTAKTIIGFVENINSRKKAEKELLQYSEEIRSQKETLEDLIENMPIAVLAKKPSDNYRYFLCNPAAEKLLQLPREKIIGNDINFLLDKEQARRFSEFDQQIVKSPRIVSVGEQNLFLGRQQREVRITKIPVLGVKKQVEYIFVLIEDFTEERSLSRQLQHSQKMDAVGRLAGGIAHDFNNMLQAILGYGSLLGEDVAEVEGARENLALILKAADQASSLVRQLMAFSRKQESHKVQTNAVNSIKDIFRMLNRLLGDHINVSLNVELNEAWIMVDPIQLEQALINLCLNARDAMPGGGTLALTLESRKFTLADKHEFPECQPGEYIAIRVKDSGKGIDAEHLQNIFEPFFTTKDIGKGTGLGLATVYAIISQHQGFITVKSEPGQGAEFEIFLPIVDKIDVVSSFKKLSDQTSSAGETVLLAEDQEMVRDYATRVLKKAGYNVIQACDGLEAVAKFKEHQQQIKILVFDVMMPNMNGRDAYEQIKLLKPDIPVLFCSGYGDDLLKTEYMVEIEGRLLAKPYSSTVFLQEIKLLLHEHGKG